jgi:hypothetical protein
MSSTVRQYGQDDIQVRIQGLENGGEVRIHIEHKSGAALIVPSCEKVQTAEGFEISTTGFDGTDYQLSIDELKATITIRASRASPILGGASSTVLQRRADIAPAQRVELRMSGDEVTMPSITKK